MNEFLKKEIIKEREGANISPINVDIQSRFLINPTTAPSVSLGPVHHIPTHKAIWLEELGKIVMDAQNMKEQNEKNLLDIQLKKMDLEFKEQWQGVTDKYGDKYEEYLKSYNDLWNKKSKLIADNKYLMNDERQEFIKKKELDHYKGRLDIQETRDKVYIQEQTDNGLSAIDEYVKIAGTYGSKDDEKVEEIYKNIADTANGLKKLTGMSEESYIVFLGKKIGGAESNRLLNEMSKIQTDDIPLSEKKAKLENIYNVFNNDKIARYQATEIVDKYYKGEDRDRAIEYMTAQMQGNNRQVINKARTEFGILEREERAIQKQKAKQEEGIKQSVINKIHKAYNDKDFSAMQQALTGRVEKFDENIKKEYLAMLNKDYSKNSDIYKITGKTPTEIVANGEYLKNFLPPQEIENLQIEVAKLESQGDSPTTALIKVATRRSNNNPILTNLIVNSLTAETNGYKKSLDIALKAYSGDTDADFAKQQLEFINTIENHRRRTSNNLTLTTTEIEDFSSDLNDLVDLLVERNINRSLAQKAVAEEIIGAAIDEYDKTHKDPFKFDNKDRFDGLNHNFSFFNKYSLNKVKNNLRAKFNNSPFLEAFASTLQPRKKLRATDLKGVDI